MAPALSALEGEIAAPEGEIARPAGEISLDDPSGPDVRALLQQHLDFANTHSPPEDVHALDAGALLDPAVTFVSFRRHGELLGVGALKQLDDRHAELKSMHTARATRGRGIGRTILEHLIGVARDRGCHRVSLETGSMAAFAPARSLYASAGFIPCGSFGDYAPSPNSTFMSLWLTGSARSRDRGKVPSVAVSVEVLREVTDEAVKAFGRLLPQLSRSAPPLDHAALARVVGASCNTVLVARAPATADGPGEIIGTLTLAIFPIPTGLRAWIEDVVVDEAAARQGVGTALTLEALRIARGQGARTVDLTSRPSREAAGRLYERLGFERRDSRLYRFTLDAADPPAAGG
jgi:putative acetyltransferase